VTTIKRTVELAARAVVALRTEELLRQSGAFEDGHFVLADGRHSRACLDVAPLLADPGMTSELCGYLAASQRDERGSSGVAVVAGAGPGAVLATETARRLGCRVVIIEQPPTAPGTGQGLVQGGQVTPGDRLLLVDATWPGRGGLLSLAGTVEAAGGSIVECAVLVDVSGGRAALTSPATGRVYPLRALWQVDPGAFPPGSETCPLCAVEPSPRACPASITEPA
jgi:orotate phosphoribosyltransferase